MKINEIKFKQENSPGFIIHRLDTLLKLGLRNAFQEKGFDFTAEQWGVLFRLYGNEGIHQSELGDRTGKDRHNITRILNLLEKNGCGGPYKKNLNSFHKRIFSLDNPFSLLFLRPKPPESKTSQYNLFSSVPGIYEGVGSNRLAVRPPIW